MALLEGSHYVDTYNIHLFLLESSHDINTTKQILGSVLQTVSHKTHFISKNSSVKPLKYSFSLIEAGSVS